MPFIGHATVAQTAARRSYNSPGPLPMYAHKLNSLVYDSRSQLLEAGSLRDQFGLEGKASPRGPEQQYCIHA